LFQHVYQDQSGNRKDLCIVGIEVDSGGGGTSAPYTNEQEKDYQQGRRVLL
jgi:hypothetical protein